MIAQGPLSRVRQFLAPAGIVILLACRGWAAGPEQKATSAETAPGRAGTPACHGGRPEQKATPGAATAAKLVRAAMESELAGDNRRRDALLRQALYDSPNDALAHWELGHVRVQGRWQSPGEVERAAQQDTRLAEYGRRRDAAALTPADQADLARWCRKNRLDDQQRVHWLAVLQLQPDNAEAIEGLGLRPYQGMMLTPAQIVQIKSQLQQVWQAMDRWSPLVAQWRKAAENHDPAIPTAVREKIAKIADPAKMFGLERALWRQVGAKRPVRLYREMLLALMPVLGGNRQPAAADSLVRHAVFANSEEVRAAAIAGLKRHPLEHGATSLIAGLRSPIEVTAEVETTANGEITAWYSLYEEGPLADVSMTSTFFWSFDLGSFAQFDGSDAAVENAMVQKAAAEATARKWGQLNRAAASLRAAVDRTNMAIRQRNSRITAVLGQLTKLDLGGEPMNWWKWWWQDYNEMYNVSDGTAGIERYERPKPVYEYSQWTQVVTASCFVAGTKVWTLTGRQPIEKIKVGDRVLAQDVETGELAYKPVLAVTTRAPGRWMKIGLGGESFTATPGHPFWVAGQGWRMAKQLAAGNRLHALSGGVPVNRVEYLEAETEPGSLAYNLIVADYDSYFVGDRGVLVHDTTPRRPTAAILPGLAKGQTKK